MSASGTGGGEKDRRWESCVIQTSWNFYLRKKHHEKFDEFWTAVPKKVGKPRAHTLFSRLEKRGDDVDAIIRWVKNYAIECVAQNVEWKFILHPATILNQRRWEDVRPAYLETDLAARREWADLMLYLKKHGLYGKAPLPLSKTGMEAVRQIGGYSTLCRSTEWTLEHKKQKEFAFFYKKLALSSKNNI